MGREKLSLNFDKSKTMELKTATKPELYSMKEKPLENLRSINYLCMTIDKKLRFVDNTRCVEKNSSNSKFLFAELATGY